MYFILNPILLKSALVHFTGFLLSVKIHLRTSATVRAREFIVSFATDFENLEDKKSNKLRKHRIGLGGGTINSCG